MVSLLEEKRMKRDTAILPVVKKRPGLVDVLSSVLEEVEDERVRLFYIGRAGDLKKALSELAALVGEPSSMVILYDDGDPVRTVSLHQFLRSTFHDHRKWNYLIDLKLPPDLDSADDKLYSAVWRAKAKPTAQWKPGRPPGPA
jgi:hypothetical protein